MVLNDPALRQKLMGGNPSTIAAYAMMMTDYSKTLSSMKVPTLIIWGKKDNVVPIRTARVLATNLPEAGMIVLKNAGHVPMLDEPLIMTNWLRRFVSENDSDFKALLKNKRYRIDKSIANASKRIAGCKNGSGRIFRGDYRVITIENCQNVVIDSARIGTLTIRNSQVVLNNCLVKSTGKAILVSGSDLQINGCTIAGSPAIEFRDSQLDIAGSKLKSDHAALKNADEAIVTQQPQTGPLALLNSSGATIIFSVTYLNSKYYEKILHGPVNFKPEQAM
jgi:hypothetical protein